MLTARLSFIASGCFLLSPFTFADRINFQCAGGNKDAANLNSVIGASHSGDQIQIHGVCVLSETITLLGNRTYEGDSRTATVLRQANGANLRALLASDSWQANTSQTGEPVRLAHFTIDGNGERNTDTDLLIIRSWLTVIEDLLVMNSPHDGIQITNLSRNDIALSGTQVNGEITNCFITNSKGNGIHVVDTTNSVTDWSLLDSWVADSGKSGIELEDAAGWMIRGNHLYGIKEDAIFASRCFGTSIEQNYIEDFGNGGGSTTRFGIACTVQGEAASIIASNRIFMLNKEAPGTRYVYIGVPRINYGVGQINIFNNSIRGSGNAQDIGMEFQLNGGKNLNLVSRGNNVQSVHLKRIIGKGVHVVLPF